MSEKPAFEVIFEFFKIENPTLLWSENYANASKFVTHLEGEGFRIVDQTDVEEAVRGGILCALRAVDFQIEILKSDLGHWLQSPDAMPASMPEAMRRHSESLEELRARTPDGWNEIKARAFDEVSDMPAELVRTKYYALNPILANLSPSAQPGIEIMRNHLVAHRTDEIWQERHGRP